MDVRREKVLKLCSNCCHSKLSDADTAFDYQKECQAFAECCGFLLRREGAENESMQLRMGSLTLMPSLYPKSVYDLALEVQPLINELYHKVANDREFLKACLGTMLDSEDFIRNLWHIYEAAAEDPKSQKLQLGLLRSDYMYEVRGGSMTVGQIEVNTIASSMSTHSEAVREIHCHLARLFPDYISPSHFSRIDAVDVLAKGLYEAWKTYGNPEAIVMFHIRSNREENFADIRKTQYRTMALGCQVMLAINDDMKDLKLTDDNVLYIRGKEIAVVYWRSGYMPDQYPDNNAWDIRLKLEKSKAIKCPSVGSQLAGSKKIQQELCRPGVVERYLAPDKAAKVRQTFLEMLSMDEPDEVIDEAMKQPENYVLKPQREGGGNNFYDSEMVTKWNEIRNSPERQNYILMRRIHPPSQPNCSLPCYQTSCKPKEMIQELGIYGAVIGDESGVTYSDHGGYLLRSKSVNENEGGFSAGFSSIDTPSLMTDADMIQSLSLR